jgi:mannosyltransferase
MKKYLIAFIVIGTVLRFYHLDYNSLWLDEAWTYEFSKMSWQGIWDTTAYEFNPPGFYWLEHIVLYFSKSEFALRLIPALFGIAEIPVMYLIGKEFYRSEKAGLISAIFMTFSGFGIWYSQEARTYTVTLVLFSLAFYYWLKAKDSLIPNENRLCGLFCALAFWTHFYIMIPVVILLSYDAIHCLSEWVVKRDSLADWLDAISETTGHAIGTFVILGFPIIYTTIRLFFIRTAHAPTYGMQGLDILWNTLYALSGNSPYPFILGLFVLAGFVLLYFRNKAQFWMLAIFTGVPLVASIGLSYLFPMLPRYLIYLLPFWILAITAFFDFPKKRMTIAMLTAASIAMLAFTPFAFIYYNRQLKQDYRGAVAYVSQKPDNTIVVMPDVANGPFGYYYQGDTAVTYTSDVSQLPNGSLYFIADDFCKEQTNSVTLSYLNEHYQRNDNFTGIHIFEEDKK